MLRSLWWCAVSLVAVGCQAPGPAASLRRLRVRAPVAATTSTVLDRDTETRVSLTAPSTFTFELTGATRLREIKLHSPRALEVSVAGHSSRHVDVTGWTTVELDQRLESPSVTVKFTPQGAEGSLAELEFWGEGLGSVAEEPPSVAGSNVVVVAARYAEAKLSPKGSAEGESCGVFEFSHDVLLADVRRAWLRWDADGATESAALKVALNDASLREALWLEGAGSRSLLEELDPRNLRGLNETAHLCLPDTATRAVTVSGVRLLLAVDDGAHWLDRDTSRRLPKLVDGSETTKEALLAGAAPLGLRRAISLDRVGIGFESSASSLELELGEAGARERLTFVTQAAVTLKKAGGGPTREVGVSATGQLRAGVPLASASELLLLGSPEGKPLRGYQLVLAHPGEQRLEHDGLHVGQYAGAALVSGWATSEAGNGRVMLDEAEISSASGAFSVVVRRPPVESAPWISTLRARYPDGTTRELTLIFDIEQADAAGTLGVINAPDAVLFGAENQTASSVIGPAGGEVKLGERIGFAAPAGALSTPTAISITHALAEVVPRLDPGMVNVTAPANAGYRFGPKGQQFAVPARITLPYDARLLPEGMSVSEIQTWYYDEALENWAVLTRKEILHATEQVVSETTHFTFMINAVLVTPEHAEPASFNPTSLKDLKAASPAEVIDLVELGDPGNTGSARLQLPIRLPRARGDFQPQLALTYDSSTSNGFVGVGWSLSTSSIVLDTRFGVPTANAEQYLLDGAALVPGDASPCSSGTGRRYWRRFEGEFSRIVRCGSDDTNYSFEVTTKTGVRFIYGAHDASRLTSYLNRGNIAEWHLEEVIDRNGNRTVFDYETDRAPRDGSDPRNGEDFRYLYPRFIHYTAESGTTTFPYTVELKQEADSSGGLVHRPDVVTSGRYGFKTTMRRRLGQIAVKYLGGIVREYRLEYERGDFDKSRLTRVGLFGRGGVAANHLFNSHQFEYYSNEAQDFTLDDWTLPADPDRLSAATESSFGVHAFAGIGFGAERSTGSVGVRLGFSHREQSTLASFLDLNGDRIPDRVTQSRLLMGNSSTKSFSELAPPGDPNAGSVVNAYSGATRLPGMGKEAGNAFNVAVQASYGPLNANAGFSFSATDSTEFLTDADGDGLVDYVRPGEVLFNEQRGAACDLDKLCFTQTKTLRTLSFALPDAGPRTVRFSELDGGGVVAADLSRQDAGARVTSAFTPNDVLVDWSAPFAGTVDINGSLAWRHPQPASAQRDGVRLRVSASTVRDGGTLIDVSKPYGEVSATPVGFTGLPVVAGQHVYFRLSTGADFPVQLLPDGGQAVPLEEVTFAPVIAYQCGAPSCQTIVDAAGDPLYRYELRNDFRPAGRPPLAVMAAHTGRMRITWSVIKPTLLDQLRLCAVRHGINAADVGERDCAAQTLVPLADDFTFAAADSASSTAPFIRTSAEFPVTAGEQLVFRAETRMAIDIRGVSARVRGVMTEVCDNGSACRPVTAEEERTLRFEVEAMVPAHGDSSALGPIPPGPFEGYEVAQDGELVLESGAPAFTCLAALPCSEITYSVRTSTRVLLVHGEGRNGADIRASARVPVRAGERIFAEAHSEVAQGLGVGLVGNPWTLTAKLATTQADGGVVERPFDLRVRRTWESQVALFSSSPAEIVRLDRSPLAGGYHGWHFGSWGAQPAEPLDLDLLENGGAGYVPPTGTQDEQFQQLKARGRDPNSYERRRARMLGVMLPKELGTTVSAGLSDGGVEFVKGLKPDIEAFVTPDATAWVAADGTWHASKKGGYIATSSGSRTIDAIFDIGDVKRSSINYGASVGIGVGPVSGSLSASRSEQTVDVLDMNGDGIMDLVGREGATLTDRSTLRAGTNMLLQKRDGGFEAFLRTNDDLGMALGLGLSSPEVKLSSKGDVKAVKAAVTTSIGGGLGVNLGVSRGELMDFNGDGLPDQVRRRGDDIEVRLNLGDGFGEPDLHHVGRWSRNDGTAAYIATFHPDAGADAGADEQEELNKTEGLVEALGTQEQLRRSVSATFNLNLGVSFGGAAGEAYGVTANFDTTLSGTEVTMLDVTGDGLPDYLRRNPDTSSGNSFLVKVNLGDGFAPERLLKVPAWPADAGPAFILPGTADPTMRDELQKVLGLGGDSLVEANGGNTRIPSIGFVVTLPALLVPVTGTPWLLISFGTDLSPQRVSGFELGFVDIDGDGLADQVLKTDSLENPINPQTKERVFVRKNNMGGGNLLRRVTRPLGGSISLTYERAGNTVALPESRWVLKQALVDDGTQEAGQGHVVRTDWAFSRGVFDRAEREFFGFGEARSTSGDKTTVTRTFDTSGIETKGLLLATDTRDISGVLLAATTNAYHPIRAVDVPQADCISSVPFFLDGVTSCTPGFVGLASTATEQFEGRTVAKVSRQRFEYDDFGNVQHFVDEGDIDVPDDDSNATVEYLPLGTRYLVGLPRKIVVRAGQTNTGTVLRGREGRYDGPGNLTHLSAWLDRTGGAIAETTLEWHPNGTLAAVTSPPNASGERYRIAYAYEQDTKTWPNLTSDSFGYTSSATYAPEFGQPLTTTDINNQTTTRRLDDFGRVISVTGPREAATGHETITIAFPAPGVAVTSNLLPDGRGQTRRLDVATFIDGLGRARQTKTTARVEALGLGMTASGAQEYDEVGRVVAQGQPVFTRSAPAVMATVPMVRPTRFTFDALGRTTSTTEANGALTRIDYTQAAPPGDTLLRLATFTTDARRKQRAAYRDSAGRVVAVTENIESRTPTTRYRYSPIGELQQVSDAAGNLTSMTYDLLGRRLTLDNPDTGLHGTTYDAAGNVTTRVTPRLRAAGAAIRYGYRFNRLEGIDYPTSEDVAYVYGAPGAPKGGAGRVVEMHDAVGVEKREYGPLGELTKQTRTVRPLRPGDRVQEYQLAFDWDSFGRALSVTYPDGEVLAYEYDEGGLLTKAVGTRASEREVYLADVGYDEFGQRVRAEYGNGVVTKYTHEPETRRLSTLTSKLSPVTGGTTFQALTYHYDSVGNVKSLANALPSPVSTAFGGLVRYTYEYDDVNRLTLATGVAASRPGVDDTFAASWEYSDIHNLTRATLQRQVTSMSGVERPPAETRDEAYGYEGVHPHRARTIGTLSLEYDEDGNTTRECEGTNCAPGRASTFVWDEEGRMEEATAKGRQVRFRYDADGQRMVKLAAGGPVFTFGQWWTMAGNSHATKHIFAGAGRVATKMIPAATVQANTPPGGTPGTGWPNTNGCIPSGNQPQKCPTNSNGTGWVERGVARPATWYYHSDSLGSTSWLTDDQGKLHERVAYYPYGEVWRQSSGQGTHKLRQAFLYTGKEYDSETGLTYFGARYYDSRRARWMSPDPALSPLLSRDVNPLLLSHYVYGAASPVTLRDEDGAIVPILLMAAGGALLDLATQYAVHRASGSTAEFSPDWGSVAFGAGLGALGGVGAWARTAGVSVNVITKVAAAAGTFAVGADAASQYVETGTVNTNQSTQKGAAVFLALLSGFATGPAPSLAIPKTMSSGLTNSQAGEIIGWPKGQAAASETATMAKDLTSAQVEAMRARGLDRATVEGLRSMYREALDQGGAKLANDQLKPRADLMDRILELWPE